MSIINEQTNRLQSLKRFALTAKKAIEFATQGRLTLKQKKNKTKVQMASSLTYRRTPVPFDSEYKIPIKH